MKYSLPALIFSVAGGAMGQLLMKAGLQGIALSPIQGVLSAAQAAPGSALLLAGGLAFYAASLPAWIIALKRFELSFAYPLISLGYLIVYVGAYYWPGMEESITWQKTIGLSLIVMGVALAAQTTQPGEWFRDAKIRQA